MNTTATKVFPKEKLEKQDSNFKNHFQEDEDDEYHLGYDYIQQDSGKTTTLSAYFLPFFLICSSQKK